MRKFHKLVCVYGLVLSFLLTSTLPVSAAQTAAGSNSANQSVTGQAYAGQTGQTGKTGQASGVVSLFKDVSSNDGNILFINYLANLGLMKGFPDKKFHPLDKVTRAEAAVLLVRAAGLKTGQDKSRFSDVTPKHWAYGSINAAVAAGFLRGYPDGKFRPDSLISRAEGLSLFLRLSKQPDPGVALPPLSDVNAKHWAARPVAIGLAAEMVGLTANKKQFLPDAPLIRGDMARVLGVMLVKDPDLAQTTLPDKLQVLTGVVKVTRAGSQVSEEIKDSTSVNAGDIVTCSANSSAELKFPDGTGVLLKEKTEIVVKETQGRSYIKADGSKGTAVELLNLDLKKGKIFGALPTSDDTEENKQEPEVKKASADYIDANTTGDTPGLFKILATTGTTGTTATAPGSKQASGKVAWWQTHQTKKVKVKVDMPWGMAAIRGTFWNNSVDEEGRSSTNVLVGTVEVESGGQQVKVAAGQVTEITKPEAPPAPPAPQTTVNKQEWVQVKEWAVERFEEIKTNQETVIAPPPPVSLPQQPKQQEPQQQKPPQQPQQPELPKLPELPDIEGLLGKIEKEVPPITPPPTTSSNEGSSPSIAVNGVTLDQYKLILPAGGAAAALYANVFPDIATNKFVTWSSSNTTIATVAKGAYDYEGIVTPKAAGTAIITVRTNDGSYTDTATVIVKDNWVAVTGITVYPESLKMYIGYDRPVILVPKITPVNASNKEVFWSSNHPEFATVSEGGVVTAISEGTAIITARTRDGNITAQCTVEVGID